MKTWMYVILSDILTLLIIGFFLKPAWIELEHMKSDIHGLNTAMPKSIKMSGYVDPAVTRISNFISRDEAINLAVLIYDISEEFNVDPMWLESIGQHESQNWTKRQSPTNDWGLWHVNGTTISMLKSNPALARFMVDSPEDLLDDKVGCAFGACYLKIMLDTFGDYKLAIPAYNGGPRVVYDMKNGIVYPAKINGYISSVNRIHNLVQVNSGSM